MSLTKKEVEHVAVLSRLELSEEESGRFTGQLNQILDAFKELSELDTENVPPTTHVEPLTNVFREDAVQKSLPVEKTLENAPQKQASFFLVPKVLQE